MSKWQEAYKVYMKVRDNCSWTPPVHPGSEQAERFALYVLVSHLGNPLQGELRKLEAYGFPCPHSWIDDVTRLYQAVRASLEARQPFEDAYQAALYMLGMPSYWHENPSYRGFRGQRKDWDKWPIKPKMFRKRTTKRALEEKLDRLASFSKALAENYPQFDEYQRIAIAQHYSEETQVATWLVDLTADPFIALFFATLGGENRDIGVVTAFDVGLWEDWGVDAHNLLGEVRLIAVPGVPRIEAQKALFLIGSHPDLIDQYIPIQLWFKQKDGLVFEDPARGITEMRLLHPDNDPFPTLIDRWKSVSTNWSKKTLSIQPPANPNRRLSASYYEKLAKSWFSHRRGTHPPFDLSKNGQALVRDLANFHAHLQKWKSIVRPPARSLLRFKGALSIIHLRELDKEALPSLREIVFDEYWNQCLPRDCEVVKQVLEQVETGAENKRE